MWGHMSVFQYVTSGGMASTGGDLKSEDQNAANEIVKEFALKVRSRAFSLQVPASLLSIQQANFLFVAKDSEYTHFVFAVAPGGTSFNYRAFVNARLALQTLVHQVRIEVGEVAWAFSIAIALPQDKRDEEINNLVEQYVSSALQALKKPNKKISEEAIDLPEIASGIEKFRNEHPSPLKTAFIIMRFGSTSAHIAIVDSIKSALQRYGIKGLRADDREYMDELFPNIKTYMHACDFGIAVFDRIDNDDFNPNVSLEVGYMLGMRKDVMLLKDATLKSLHTDLTGKLYRPFDTQKPAETIPNQVENWLSDKGYFVVE